MNVTTAADFLRAGLKHMEDRAKTYDKPEGERSMRATVRAFQQITGIHINEEQGWLFMAMLKAVRSQQGPYRADSYEDGAAYFALAGEAASKYRDKSLEEPTAPPNWTVKFAEGRGEWTGWFPGLTAPPRDAVVEVRCADGSFQTGPVYGFSWGFENGPKTIASYRVLK